MGRSRMKRGFLPPLRSGHSEVFWVPLSDKDLDRIQKRGYVYIRVQLPDGSVVRRRVTKSNLFKDMIGFYRRSNGKWALRNIVRDRAIKASHIPEPYKGMTGDRPYKKRRRGKKR